MNATRLVRASAVAALLVGAGLADGQAYLQQGNALDANPRVNSGGLNYGARQYGGSLANRIVTGNVGGGAAFRGYSPVRDPNSLFITNYAQAATSGTNLSGLTSFNLANFNSSSGLPSDRLTAFDRESVSVATVRSGYVPGSLNRRPYYSPSSTVANTGAIISGLNRPGSSQLISPYVNPHQDLRIKTANPLDTMAGGQGTFLSVSPRLVRIDNGQSLTGPVNERLLGSRLFGAVREVPVDALAAQARRGSGGALSVPPIDRRIRTPEEARRDAAEQSRRTDRAGGNQLTGNAGDVSQTPPGGADQAARGGLRVARDAGTLANTGDVYGLMRRASGTLARRVTPGLEASVAQREPRAGVRLPAGGPTELTEADVRGPIRTFAGTQGSAVNYRLGQAEDLLKQGQYYRAAEVYGAAQIIDSANPLPLLGRSVALLAAGDYMTSANSLFTAIRLFDSLALFDVDLKAFVPDANVLESRRADLESRLQVFDDFRLRFLLGYLQYSTGQKEAGLANLEAAAGKFPGSFEAGGRFVARLREKQQAQPAPATRPAS